jgi:hypothetical protein
MMHQEATGELSVFTLERFLELAYPRNRAIEVAEGTWRAATESLFPLLARPGEDFFAATMQVAFSTTAPKPN